MFTISKWIDGRQVLNVNLPKGMTMAEINEIAVKELDTTQILESLYGENVIVYGRCTTALAMLLGHRLAHICKSVSVYDPKEDQYVAAVWH